MADRALIITDPVAVAKAFFEELRASGFVVPSAPSASAPHESATWSTTEETCREIKCSRAKLLRMRAEGAPCHYVGESPRWDIREIQAWCDARGPKGFASKPKAKSSGDLVVLKRRHK